LSENTTQSLIKTFEKENASQSKKIKLLTNRCQLLKNLEYQRNNTLKNAGPRSLEEKGC
jgi:hypothetical protein